MKTIIVAAGMGVSLDGANRLSLVVGPDGNTVFDRLRKQFGDDLIIVVGYRAADVISSTYTAKHVLNPFWHETGSAYSAFLGLDALDNTAQNEQICIIPSDLIFSDMAVEQFKVNRASTIFGIQTEFRHPESANLALENDVVKSVYMGHVRNISDPLYRGPIIFDAEHLYEIKELCRNNSDVSVVEAVLKCKQDFRFGVLSKSDVFEINSVVDYLTAKESL